MIRHLPLLAVLALAACAADKQQVVTNLVGSSDPCPVGLTDVLSVDQPAGSSFKVCVGLVAATK